MSSKSGEHVSFWRDSARLPRFARAKRGLSVDAVVVGGGIAGVTAAYLLKRSGRTVALLERDRCGGVDTGQTTAHLTYVTDERLHGLVKKWGEERASAVWHAGMAAIDTIVSNIRAERIDCEFTWVPGYLHTPLDGKPARHRKGLERDAELAQKLGFHAEFIEAVPYFELPGVKFSQQAKFHPLKYLAGLLRAIPGDGSHVFENTEAMEVQDKPFAVKAGSYTLRCRFVVLATHVPLMGKTNVISAALLQTKLYPYTTYAVGAKVPRGVLPEASFWDTADPYHHLRVDRRRGFDYVIFGGADHKTGQVKDTRAQYRQLQETLRKHIPRAKIDHRWSGQVIETNDGLPYIGETSRRQLAATGFSGNGMTFGTLGAMMAVDAFLRRRNPWSELFAVDRKKIRGGALTYIKENKDYPYYLLRDRLARAAGKSLSSVRRGQGKILSRGGRKVAAYRDDGGKVTLCSPVCTHLGCIVRWNPAEKTWDCPCHGSRFEPTGEVLAGPAEEPLEKLELEIRK